jgi:hypothetical protein
MTTKMIEVKLTDNSTSVFTNVADLQRKVQSGNSAWSEQKIKAFNLTMAKLVETEEGWVAIRRVDDKGNLEIVAGYKLDLIQRMLTGKAPLPILREDSAA